MENRTHKGILAPAVEQRGGESEGGEGEGGEGGSMDGHHREGGREEGKVLGFLSQKEVNLLRVKDFYIYIPL